MDVPGYEIVQELARQGAFALLRARRRQDGRAVLLKVPLRVPIRRMDRAALDREHDLLASLAIPGLPRILQRIDAGERVGLVFDDHGRRPLSAMVGREGLDVAAALRVAIELCSIVGQLHRRRIIHAGICPTTVLAAPDTGEAELLHVGVLSGGDAAERASGEAAYISPEQTGRINRHVDYRTDFYSLGATLYFMLTGAPPFASDDSLALVHAHIARVPADPSQLNARVPGQLSQIVLKLLSKAAEDRYQSASGLEEDLRTCLREWSAHGAIPRFALASADVADRLLFPQKLYGRDREVAGLLRAFEDTCAGGTRLMLVAGYSGIGKTSLIQELYRPIIRHRGYFITGKFDQVVRNIPYGALTQALRSLVWQLLTEREDRLAAWRERLGAALGANGGVLAEVIPEVELIIGPQPPPPALEPTEARNRFGYVFQRFVGTLAHQDHPLVIFLDDLQWVDAATLDLLHALLTSPDIRHLFLIGAYRDNEVDATHALTWSIDRLKSSGAHVDRLSLGPLAPADLIAFLCDTLHAGTGDVAPLAHLLQQRTDGNPFFVIQFLKSLEQDGVLVFDRARASWSYRMNAIAAAGFTDNVVDLMAGKIRRLPPSAQDVLTLAACVGNPFDWDTLVAVGRRTEADVSAGLSLALEAGLIQPVNAHGSEGQDRESARYAFVHDRVQQAAYGLIPEAHKAPVHLELGRLLSRDFDVATPDDRIFAILSHLNIASALITGADERLALARLNLAGGRKAKTSAAYRAAIAYCETGIRLSEPSWWQSEYALLFGLHLELAECHYLAGAFEAADQICDFLLQRARGALDAAQVHLLRMTLYEHQSRWSEAVASGRDGLRLFGISFPASVDDKARQLEAEIVAVHEHLGGRAIAELVALPEMTDPDMRMVMRMLTTAWAPAYISGDQVLARLISATMVRLSLTYGNTEDSAYGYVTHAISVGPLRNEFRTAFQWGELALAVNQRFNDLKRRAKIHQQFQAHVNPWCRPLDTCIPHAREALHSGLEAGDFTYAGYGAATEAWAAFLVSHDLRRFVRDYTPTLALLDKIKMRDFHAAHRVLLQWALALQGLTATPLSLTGDAFDEQAFIASYEEQAPFFLTFAFAARLHLSVLFDEPQAALAAARRARECAGSGTIWPVMIEIWSGLAIGAAWDSASAAERPPYRQQLADTCVALQDLAEASPDNFRSWLLILQGELARMDAASARAASLLDEAVTYAKRVGSIQQEGMAHERRAALAVQRGDAATARTHLAAAKECYVAWGAVAKVAHLESHYATWLDDPAAGHAAGTLLPATQEEVDATLAHEGVLSAERRASLDMETVLRVAHAIAVELEVGGLLKTLMHLALENAGADRGIFLQERGGALAVEAEATIDPQRVTVGGLRPLERIEHIAASVVRWVHRTGHDVVLGNAKADERFASDPHLAGASAKSILCVPVSHQGRLGGILYLENTLTSDAFTPERLEMMRILAAQTAISLENARLYADMKSEVARRMTAEHALRDALAELERLKNRLEAENVYLQEEIRTQHNFNEIVGNSAPLLEALRRIERVAPTESTVLIVGETGVGKELFARAIHSRSRRSGRPLVKVNCGAIAPGLVESELFGHVKGAFTGAIDKRVGRFELADGGTIFLDEVGELPLDAQVKLLRVLQEQEFEPVGSSRTVRVSVRVIAATNRNLEQAVREGRFRADLLYRLNVFPIEVPSLRQRASDIPLLVSFFCTGLARKLGKPIQGFSGASMERMQQYAWPGNVRELQNVVERAAILATGSVLELEPTLFGDAPVVESPMATPVDHLPGVATGSLEDIQRLHIVSVLKSTGGVVEGAKGAASILGLHPNTLRSRMKKLGIPTTFRSS